MDETPPELIEAFNVFHEDAQAQDYVTDEAYLLHEIKTLLQAIIVALAALQ